MALQPETYIALPASQGTGGFDHADTHGPSDRLYVAPTAIGDPGVIDVVDVDRMQRVETVATEAGAHTIALDRKRNRVFAFLPRTHRAAVYRDLA